MITINDQSLEFSFPELHKTAGVNISFQRTLRIPDDGRDYPLPAGLGKFPLFHTEDFANNLSEETLARAGALFPMYQSEAMWIDINSLTESYSSHDEYPCAIKIGTGKICAITGNLWQNKLSTSKQDYLVFNEQPWLDGYRIDEDTVRQFVAMPLGEGYTAEEQITGEANWGGIQIMVIPMKRTVYDELFGRKYDSHEIVFSCKTMITDSCMGIAPGGKIRQEIYDDPYGADVWDMKHAQRCFIHTLNSKQFKSITGLNPPATPINRADYQNGNLPWFDYYSDSKSIMGKSKLNELDSVAQTHLNKHWEVLPDNQAMEFDKIVKLSK